MSEAQNDPLVTTRHMRACGLCVGGSRAFFASVGLSWPDFIREGIPASRLEATGNFFALKAVAAAREEAASGR